LTAEQPIATATVVLHKVRSTPC